MKSNFFGQKTCALNATMQKTWQPFLPQQETEPKFENISDNK